MAHGAEQAARFVAMLSAIGICALAVAVHHHMRKKPAGAPRVRHYPRKILIFLHWLITRIEGRPGDPPAPAPDRQDEHYSWGGISYEDAAHRVAAKAMTTAQPSPLPALKRPGKVPGEFSPLARWVGESIQNGAEVREIVRRGKAKFGASESTIRRNVAMVKKLYGLETPRPGRRKY